MPQVATSCTIERDVKYLLVTMIYQDYLDLQQLQRYASAMNARAKRYRTTGKLTSDLLRDRIFASGGRCEWCDEDLVQQEFELDHIESLSRGGSNTPANLVVSCPSCNRRKSGKHSARFASEIFCETGKKTDLLNKLFEQYGVMPTIQQSLFEIEPTLSETDIDVDDDLPAIPPYQW